MIPLLYIGLSQSAFAFFIIVTKRPKYIHDLIFAVWLFFIASEMALSLVLESHWFIPLLNISLFFPMTYLPFLYLYVKYLIDESPEIHYKDLIHFIPALVYIVFVSLFLINEPIFSHPQKLEITGIILRHIYMLYFLFSLAFYGYRILSDIHLHQQNIQDKFSFTSRLLTLNWVKFILTIFFISITGLVIMGMFFVEKNFFFDPRFFNRLGLTIFAFSVSYFGIKQPTLFRFNRIVEVEKSNEPRQNKYERSGLTEDQARQYGEQLSKYMETDKPFLDPELNIQDLAAHLKISRHHLTQIINSVFDKNFFHYINTYRIEEVKQRLMDPQYQYLTLLAIAMDCGFNSKSAFNAIFKKYTGQTPSEYRKVQN